jgi:hypothetical protein
MENFNLSFPIDMIKKEERIVSGIATADNIDKSGDIVEFNASLEAFKTWGGNIREMHHPIAVGKAINYEPIQITGEDGKTYNAIKVDAYISKGAQNTWEKILDGTLQAFSIGGKVLEKMESTEKMFRGRPVKVIKKYILGELSLVDNPANALAVVDIIKMNSEGALDYILEDDLEKAKQPLKDPKGGLTAAGRRHFKETEGANLKPGVRGAANTPEKMRRKGSFLTRFFTNPSGPMKDEKGRPTRLALSATAWGEPVPQDRSDAAALAAKGRRLLERYAKTKQKSADEIMEEDAEILTKEMEYFLSADYEEILKEGEVTTSGMGSGIKNPTQGSFKTPTMPSPSKKKKKKESYMDEIKNKSDDGIDIIKDEVNSLQNDVNYDKVLSMNEQEINRLSLLKRVVNWLVPDVQEYASTENTVEVTENTQEEQMDIEILKDALSAVVDDKLANFATSIKEEVEASLNEKIDNITKSFEANTVELQEKVEAAEKALSEQEEQVKAFAEAGAIKKSVDPEDADDEEELQKSDSIWGNTYLPQPLIKALGYES